MNDDILRQNLLELLDMGSAHLTLDQALDGLDLDYVFERPSSPGPSGPHSVWELLEHMRIAQEDLLRYTLDSTWESPPFPHGYWPEPPVGDTAPQGAEREEVWRVTLEGFRDDLEEVRELVRDPGLDLTSRIPHGEGRTYLRQVLLVADHNAYHLGQLVDVRRALGIWA